MRTHLYGSLLYYLQIAQRPDEPDTLEAGMVQLYFGKEKKKTNQKTNTQKNKHAEIVYDTNSVYLNSLST